MTYIKESYVVVMWEWDKFHSNIVGLYRFRGIGKNSGQNHGSGIWSWCTTVVMAITMLHNVIATEITFIVCPLIVLFNFNMLTLDHNTIICST